MLKFLQTLFFILQLTVFVAAQQWYPSYAPRGRDINSVVILSDSTIASAGGNEYNGALQAVFFSHNRGLSWDLNPADTIDGWIKSIAFSNSVYGIGVGFDGKILRTNDGGHVWFRIPSPLYTRHFNKVFFVDSLVGYIAGGLRVNDSIATIDTVNLTVDSMQTILKTIDGGDTWNVIYDEHGPWLKSIYFTDRLNGVAVGDEGMILRTGNGGSTWTPVSSPVQRDFNQVTFINNQIGYIVGGHWSPDTLRTIVRTVNGGLSWTVLKDEPGGWLTDISFMNPDTGYIVGYQATLMKTIDGGLTWAPEIIPGASSGFQSGFYHTVRFFNKDFGVIGGRFGEMYIFTHSALPEAYTIGSESDTTRVDFYGAANTHGYPALYSFVFSSDSNFVNFFTETYPADVPDEDVAFLQQTYWLDPDTTYYFFIKAWTHAGTVYGDTLSGFTGANPLKTFKTLSATGVANNSAKLNGTVKGLKEPVNLYFEYGPSLNFGNQIVAVPALVNDTLPHHIYANISSLQPNQQYFFRLKGTSSSRNYYGNTLAINAPFTALQTLPVLDAFDSVVGLNGVISGAQYPTQLSFEYSAGAPDLDLLVNANPFLVNDTSAHLITAQIGTDSSTLYYFRLKAQSALGTFYGDTLVFLSRYQYQGLQTLSATHVGLSSAQLNGSFRLNQLPSSVSYSMSFEYGNTPAMGTEIQAVPAVISDTFFHSVSVVLTGLQSNNIYYYRIKAKINAGPEFYGAVKQLYLGPDPIPNWDFEFWEPISKEYVNDWFIYGNTTRVPSYNSSHALHLQGDQDIPGVIVTNTISIFANPAPGPPPGGTPFTARPDSIIFFANYDVAGGDSALVFVVLRMNGASISENIFYLTGSTGGVFQRHAFPLVYSASGNPDTVAIGITSSNFMSQNLNPQSWVEIDDISFSGTTQNVPNYNFEDWDTLEYDAASGWAYSTRESPPGLLPFFPFTKTTDAFSGNYAIRFQSIIHIPFPAAAYLTTDTLGSSLGKFSIQHRYVTFNGYFKFLPQNGDSLIIEAQMYKNDSMIGQGLAFVDTPVLSYSPFAVPILYHDSTTVPDACILWFRSAGYREPQGNSVVYLDDLSFDGLHSDSLVTAVPPLVDVESSKDLTIFPNPVSSVLTVEMKSAGSCRLDIYDLRGKMIFSDNFLSERAEINIKDFPAGLYLIRVFSGTTAKTARFLIVR